MSNNSNKFPKFKLNHHDIDPQNVDFGDFNIRIDNMDNGIDPFKLLEELAELKKNNNLTNEEKSKKLQKLFEDYNM